MDSFFKDLGSRVLERWQSANFSLEKFPSIAQTALEERPPVHNVELSALMKEFLIQDDQPLQSQSGFGQPEIIAYDHPRFYIQLLFWLDGTTDIHQHEFSGAFHVMHGSSIHARYEFENGQSVTPHLRVGDVRMKDIELLETGRTVQIVSGPGCIHSLFHLDTPSVTVVVRTQNDPGTGPQFNYLPPHIAVDPMLSDTLTMRRKQLLDVLEETGSPGYGSLVLEMLARLDFERGFFILQHSMGRLREIGEWEAALALLKKRHGKLATGVAATLEEGVRRDLIKNMRGAVTDPEHRFFLALLMNAPGRTEVLKLVGKRFPETPAKQTILRWAQELAEMGETGVAVLDAGFPAELGADPEVQPDIFFSALLHFLGDGKKLPPALRGLTAEDVALLRETFLSSSLRVLLM